MKVTDPKVVLHSSPDLARAWAKALGSLTERGVKEISPLIVNITGFEDGFPTEDPTIRSEVDHALEEAKAAKPTLCSIDTTANLIFPESLWLRYQAEGRDTFFAKYLKLVKRLEKRDRRNHKGTYFSRMLGKHQLQHVLDTWDQGTHRRSALQIAIFDPEKDHTKQPFLGFPCLDYVAFTPRSDSKTLSVTALYADQWIFDRGYGNYVGLCRLGRFVAQQMGLRFAQLTCIASCAQLGEAIGKEAARALANRFGGSQKEEASDAIHA